MAITAHSSAEPTGLLADRAPDPIQIPSHCLSRTLPRLAFAINASTQALRLNNIRTNGQPTRFTMTSPMSIPSLLCFWNFQESTLARSEMEIVENHSYHDHPIGGPNGYEDVGASLRNDSLLGVAGKDFTAFLGTRLAGRAYFVTEWGVPYWNEFRHENALFAPAYASFQRFSLLGQHGWPVALSSPTPIRVFHLANDPTARAADRVAALLFLRGDVAPARHQASIAMDEKIARTVGLQHGIRSDLLRAGLVTGLSLSPPQPIKPGTVQFTPGRGSALKVVVGASVNEGGGDLAIQTQWSGALRAAGILDSTNRTDIQQLRYESDTHQLFLDARARTMVIDTPLSVGGVLTAEQRRLDIPRVTVTSDGTPLSVCISSLTALPIEQSPRTLVIVATDARNSGLKTRRDGDREVMTDKGGAPVLLRSFRLELSIQRHEDTPIRAWALREDGYREYEIPVNQTADSVSLIIDTANPEVPPTSYVELAIR